MHASPSSPYSISLLCEPVFHPTETILSKKQKLECSIELWVNTTFHSKDTGNRLSNLKKKKTE